MHYSRQTQVFITCYYAALSMRLGVFPVFSKQVLFLYTALFVVSFSTLLTCIKYRCRLYYL